MYATPLSDAMRAGDEICWVNPRCGEPGPLPYADAEILDAEARLRRFAPLIKLLFPETAPENGLIESPLSEIPAMRQTLQAMGVNVPGRLFLKRDCDLPVAGSVKARGGIYEVLKHTEDLALANGLLQDTEDDYRRLTSPEARAFFGRYKMQVGSTGNLGMSIGIMSAALGYEATIHMSADAKAWKKALLREKGVTVAEYDGDYAKAVENGRKLSEADPNSYFVDDENSKELFLGYATAALRLKDQLAAQSIRIDAAHPLYVYIPCGVGGAPGGIAYGLKRVFGEHAHCFFAEPTQAPCVTLGLITGLHNKISVQDIGLTGKTNADGLAVGRCSGLVCRAIERLVNGCATVKDERLPVYQKALWQSEGVFIEPSSAAAFHALPMGKDAPESAVHIVWATGGRLVPDDIRTIELNMKNE